jgi:Zn-dependent protease
MIGKNIWALAAITYVGIIYTTSGLMRGVLNNIRQIEGLTADRLSLVVSLGLIALLVAVLGLGRRVLAGRQLSPLLLLTLCGYGLALWLLPIPEERFHLCQYGLLSLLCTRALPEWIVEPWRALLVILLVTAAGAGDELIQHFRPNRVGDWHDVWLNGAAAVLAQGLLTSLAPTSRGVSEPGEIR